VRRRPKPRRSYTLSSSDKSRSQIARNTSAVGHGDFALARVLDGGFGFALIRIARPSG
jgi:hypothetical protein